MVRKTQKVRRQRHRSKRMTRGGRFLGQGSYGCTFGFPPLQCVGEPIRKSDSYISKYVKKEEAEKEQLHSSWFLKFDPENKYFITVTSVCDIDPDALLPDNQFSDCDISLAAGNKLLFFKHAGVDLFKFRPKPANYIPFYKSLLNLFDGLQLAHSNRTYHRDIKLDNVVTQQLPDGTFQTRFIDLGLSIHGPLEDAKALEYYGTIYYIWPFDLYFAYILNQFPKNNARNLNSRMEYIFTHEKFFNQYVKFSKSIAKFTDLYYPLLDSNGKPLVDYHAIRSILQSPENLALNNEERIRVADIYSLGQMLTLCFRYLGLVVGFDGEEMTPYLRLRYKINNKQYIVELSQLFDDEIDADVVSWYYDVATDIYIPILELQKHMCNPNPANRWSLEAAKEHYQTVILPHIELLLTEESIYAAQEALDDFTIDILP